MALKDLKSDLSKFRMPKKDPLESKERVDVNKKQNQTPLSSMVESAPKIPRSQTTTNKEGVDPRKFDNSPNFLGETDPSKMNNQSQFLGETTPNKADNQSQFLGETTPNKADNQSQFLGETTPKPMSLEERYLGQTTPTTSEPTSQFLGETTPTPSDRSSNFLGETTPTKMVQGDKDKGETTPTTFNFNPNHSDRATTPTDVNYFQDIHSKGFTSIFGGVESTKFIGVNPDQTQFDGIVPITGKFVSNEYKVSTQNDSGIGKEYTDKVLKTTYNKFNLKEDSHNSSIFKQPFILSGIQREKGEPQTLGFGSFSFIRGGAVTATQRATLDVVRLSQFLLTPRGITWTAKQVGLQRSQKFGKVFTPANTLTAAGGQNRGLRPDRSGILGLDVTGKYKIPLISGYYDKLSDIYKTDLFSPTTFVGSPFISQTDTRGGFDSVYGIGVTTTTRYENTIDNSSQKSGNDTADYTQTYEPLGLKAQTLGTFDTYKDDLPVAGTDEYTDFGLTSQPNETGGGVNLKTDTDTIKKYETVAYGKLPDRVPNSPTIDFRSLLDGKQKDIAKSDDYSEYNINKRVNFPTPGKISETENRTEWWRTEEHEGNSDRYDKVTASPIGSGELNDLVHFWITNENGGDRIQFRGTVSGISDTFSPSWDSIQYNGRADQAYKYSTFDRSVSFNFQAYATSRIEMKPLWNKLQRLSTMTMPKYSGKNGYEGILVRFRLGNLYYNKLAFIESLTYTISDELPWEISMLGSNEPIGEIPMGADVAIGFKILDDRRPQYRQKVYDWNF